MPVGLYALKSYLLAQGRSAEVLNLALLSRRVHVQVRAHMQPISGPVDSMLKAWEEAYGAVKVLIQRFPARGESGIGEAGNLKVRNHSSLVLSKMLLIVS